MEEHKSERTYIDKCNSRIFKIMSIYLNLAPDYINKSMVDEITGGGDFGIEFAYASLLASACGLNVYDDPADKKFFRDYVIPMVKQLDIAPYETDPFYRNISFPKGDEGNWTFENRVCRAYEAFVFDDPQIMPDGRVIPQIGFFTQDYPYPAVLENGREWMTLMPNETNTTKPAVEASRGNVLTYGLGLGYYAYMAARKNEVTSVTVVERSAQAIDLFSRLILPQFECKDKIKVFKDDAFHFAETRMSKGKYDVVFTDLWHDPSDGVELYQRMKSFESCLPNARFIYWIEKTLKLYM